jgi:putative transposase
MDWIYDQLFDGRRIWVLTMVDTHSRICPALRVCRVANAAEVVSALDEAVQRHGAPARIRVGVGATSPPPSGGRLASCQFHLAQLGF